MVTLVQTDADEYVVAVAAASGQNRILVVGHHRWRLLSPDSDLVSGRAVRARIASLLI